MQVSSVGFNNLTAIKQAKRVTAKNSVNFRGDIVPRNPNQFMSIAPETKGNEMKSYDEGGLACVAKEAPESWYKDLHADIRTILPYHASNNKDGLMKLAVFKNNDEMKGLLPPDLSNVRNVSPNYVPRENERFVLINSSIESEKIKDKVTGKFNTINKGYKFAILEPTNVKGSIETLSEWDLVPEQLEYRFFRQPGTDKKEPKYYVHTKQVALMPRCYGLGSTYQTGQVAGQWWDLYYANFNRIIASAMPQLAKKVEDGGEGFNPANVWMHDRPAFAFQYEVAKRSARGESFYNGLKMHSTLHNPGHAYQGYYEDSIGFVKIAYDENAFKELQKEDCFNELRLLSKKAPEKLSENEKERRDAILGEYFDKLKDDNKLGNITMMAIANSIENKDNSTVGTVSMNYGKEMKDENLQGIADGLTQKLNTPSLETHDITNGNEPAALQLDIDGNFGRGGNNLTVHKDGYSRYSPVVRERKIVKDGVVTKERIVINYSPEERNEIISDGELVTSEEKAKHDELTKELQAREVKLQYKEKEQELKDLHQEIHGNSALSKEKKNEFLEKEKELQKKFEEIKKQYNEGKVPDKKRNLDSIFEFKTVKEAKQANKKWLLDLISKAADETGNVDNEELRKVFYNEEQINNGLKAHGYISAYQEGDKVFSSWGRADEQKGFATLLQGFYKYLTSKGDEDFEKQKIHTKLLFGSAGTFNAPEKKIERKLIYDYIDKIQKLDGGKYKGNVCFVEGFFPNKLVAASDWTIFTSRYEPCGITPLESFAAGVPVLSIKTGGAPDFVKHLDLSKGNKSNTSAKDNVSNANGILTEHAFMLSKKTINSENNPNVDKDFDEQVPDELDEARREILSDEIANLFKKANSVSEEVYDELAKNACKQEIEWTKNKAYNGGEKTANDRYMEEVFDLEYKDEALKYDVEKPRNMENLTPLTDKFGKIEGNVKLDADPIELIKKEFVKNNSSTPSFSGNLKKYNALSSIIAYAKI